MPDRNLEPRTSLTDQSTTPPTLRRSAVLTYAGLAIVGGLLWAVLLLAFPYDVPLIPLTVGFFLGAGLSLAIPSAGSRPNLGLMLGWCLSCLLVMKLILGWQLLNQSELVLARLGVETTTIWSQQLLQMFGLRDLFNLFYIALAASWVISVWRRPKQPADRPSIAPVEKPPYYNDLLIAQIVPLLILAYLAMLTGVFPNLGLITVGMVSTLVWYPRHRAFLRDLLPVLFTLLVYSSLRAFADDLAPSSIHITDIIHWEMALFQGHLPTAWVQHLLWDIPATPYLTALFSGFYYSHFILPLVLISILWQRQRSLYWPFVGGLIALSFAAFATYLLFPAAPPWWATYHGYLQGEFAVLSHTSAELMLQGPNPVAAMPSLHMASPTYIALFTTFVWKRRGWWLWIFPLGVGFSTLYLGHHYVIDLIAGVVYASVIFLMVRLFLRRLPSINPNL